MASSSRALALNKLATRKFGVARVQQQHAVSSRILTSPARSLTTTTLSSRRPLAAGTLRPIARQIQRQYSESSAPPPKKAGKIRRTFRWTWRLFYLSVLGTLAYVSYEVWNIRHPEPQVNPDPSKKTLVILGKLMFRHLSVNGLVVVVHR
jgi:NADH:ubiquinone reductase (non-electrogenic)